MTSPRSVGRIIGALLVAQLATGLIVPYVLLQPLTAAPAVFLENAARMSSLVRFNVLLLFVGGAIPVGTSIATWSVVRERSQGLGLWLMSLALINFTLQILENSHWLTMLSVSQAYVEAGAPDGERFRTLGIAVRSAWKWAHYSHIFAVVGWLFTLFLLLFRTARAPRAITALGMSLSMLHFIGITLPAFAGYRMPFPTLFGMPLGFGILALAAWLMARGFREPDDGTHAGVPERVVVQRRSAGRT
jgi:hypothetical protein